MLFFLSFFFFLRISLQHYEKISEETLENLCEIIDQLLEDKYPNEFDVSLSVSHLIKHSYVLCITIFISHLFALNRMEYSQSSLRSMAHMSLTSKPQTVKFGYQVPHQVPNVMTVSMVIGYTIMTRPLLMIY